MAPNWISEERRGRILVLLFQKEFGSKLRRGGVSPTITPEYLSSPDWFSVVSMRKKMLGRERKEGTIVKEKEYVFYDFEEERTRFPCSMTHNPWFNPSSFLICLGPGLLACFFSFLHFSCYF
jgi:hypothetical protein